jgi:DNA-binding response OmpR family regulator
MSARGRTESEALELRPIQRIEWESMSGSTSSKTESRKLILVVDDDPQIRSIVARALSPMYAIRQAEDGLVGAEELTRTPAPDLVILDVMMPHADGISLAESMKASSEFRTIPIIFLTARASPADLVQGIQAGARAYITKPFKLEELRLKVAKVLG